MPETSPSISTQPCLMDHVRAHGSESSDYAQNILASTDALSGADFADIAHFLCMLHGRHPGVVDNAATRTVDRAARDWLLTAIEAFTAERAFLTKLTVAAGPVSGVGADDESSTTVLAQRKAIDMLSRSDRRGCALGASLALVLDWHTIRPMLDKIAIRLGVEPRRGSMPTVEVTEALYNQMAESPAIARALNFGADQILSQHSGLWKLLEARRNARVVL